MTSIDMAVLPIPGIAFFMPKITFNAPDRSEFLAKCGGKQQMNRTVRANYGVCAPTIFLTTLITLGILGVCPTSVGYSADVIY